MIYIQINGKNNEFFQKSLTLMIRMELKQNKTKKKGEFLCLLQPK